MPRLTVSLTLRVVRQSTGRTVLDLTAVATGLNARIFKLLLRGGNRSLTLTGRSRRSQFSICCRCRPSGKFFKGAQRNETASADHHTAKPNSTHTPKHPSVHCL